MIEPEEAALAVRQQRTRLLLLVGIVVALGASIVMHLKLAARRNAAEAGETEGPAARVRGALADADRAVINRDLGAAWTALEEARGLLDELIVAEPRNPDLGRARMVVARRLANVALERGQGDVALDHLKDAYERAAGLHDADPANDRARNDRAQVARVLAESLRALPDPAGAAQVAEDAAQAIEGSVNGLNPNAALRTALSDLWLDAARGHAALQAEGPARANLARATEQAFAAVPRAEDPVGAQARLYGVLMTAAELCAGLLDEGNAEAYERQAVTVLETRERLEAAATDLPRLRAALLVRLSDRALKLGRPQQAKEDLERSLALRRSWAEKQPGDAALIMDVVRGYNHMGAFHSEAERDADALTAYAQAVAWSEKLTGGGGRLRVLSLGNYSQLLGRLDRTREARAEAAKAYEAACALRDGDPQADLDAAVAGLRYARLLRARPGADKKRARAVTEAEQARARGWVGDKDLVRYKQTVEGLDALAGELR